VGEHVSTKHQVHNEKNMRTKTHPGEIIWWIPLRLLRPSLLPTERLGDWGGIDHKRKHSGVVWNEDFSHGMNRGKKGVD
jgi:hypothetical protein